MTADMNRSGGTPYAAVAEAMLAYFQKVNKEDGGVCGRNVVLLPKDDKYAPHLALDQTRKLVEQDQVLAMIGAFSTEGHRDVATYLNDPNADGDESDGVPDLFLSTGWSAYGDPAAYPWTMSFIPDHRTDGAVLGSFILDSSQESRVAVVYKDDDVGKDYLEGVRSVIDDSAMAATEPHAPDATGLDDQIARVRESGADAVILATTPELAASAIRKAREDGYGPRWLVGYTNAPSTLAAEAGGGASADELLVGFRILDGTVSTAYLMSPVENESAGPMVEHRRIMEAFQGPEVSSLSVYGQSLAELTVETVRRACKDLTRGGVMRAARSIEGFRSSLMLPDVDVTYGSDDHLGVEALQPVEILSTGQVRPIGEVISASDRR
jgi:hypothetical protein